MIEINIAPRELASHFVFTRVARRYAWGMDIFCVFSHPRSLGGSDDTQARKYDGSFRVSSVGGSTATFKFNGEKISHHGVRVHAKLRP